MVPLQVGVQDGYSICVQVGLRSNSRSWEAMEDLQERVGQLERGDGGYDTHGDQINNTVSRSNEPYPEQVQSELRIQAVKTGTTNLEQSLEMTDLYYAYSGDDCANAFCELDELDGRGKGSVHYLDIIRKRNETIPFIAIGLSLCDFEAIIYDLSRAVTPGGYNDTCIANSFAPTSAVGTVDELYLVGYKSIESASFEVRNGTLLIEY
jgi:hypothetical protein